eukprot:COSAG05_NODE_4529_length_1476_cov_1552.782135_2_plen_84_part_00
MLTRDQVQLKAVFNRGGNVQTASFVTMATRPQGDNLDGLAALRWSVVGLMSVIFLDAGFALVNAVHMRKRMEYCTKPVRHTHP